MADLTSWGLEINQIIGYLRRHFWILANRALAAAVCVPLFLLITLNPTPVSAANYDKDDRLEHFELKKTYKEYARSIAAIVPLKNLQKSEKESVAWPQTYA